MNFSPCVTGNIGTPALAYSSRRYSANAQKCGGVQAKIIKNSVSASAVTSPVIAAQPSTGGMAPDAPPMTIFCGVMGLRITV